MKMAGMTEEDLNGELFVHFPTSQPLAESRDSMEMLIAEAWEDDYADGRDGGECLEMAITPYWVWRALCVKSRHEVAGMTREARRAEIAAWREERRRRLAERGIRCADGNAEERASAGGEGA